MIAYVDRPSFVRPLPDSIVSDDDCPVSDRLGVFARTNRRPGSSTSLVASGLSRWIVVENIDRHQRWERSVLPLTRGGLMQGDFARMIELAGHAGCASNGS